MNCILNLRGKIITAFFLLSAFCRADIPEQDLARIAHRSKLDPGFLSGLAAYFYPPVLEPVREGFSLAVPREIENQRLAELGLVDVTAAPFLADPSGRKDATRTIQQAVDFAKDNSMAVFFPAGTYLISDTIEARQNLSYRMNGRIIPAKENSCILIGAVAGSKRPVLLLADQAPGFGDPQHPKIAVHFRNRSAPSRAPADAGTDSLSDSSGTHYNAVFRNIDITIGRGNSGAIGIRMQAAEGSGIMNVTIDARHGLTGMQGTAGSGGGHHNITVIGGRIGIDTRGFPPEYTMDRPGTQPGPTMAGITLIGQTGTPLFLKARGTLTAVGWRIIMAPGNHGPAVINYKCEGSPFDSELCLIDSAIEFPEYISNNTLLQMERSFLIENTYLKNCQNVLSGSTMPAGAGWHRVRRIAYAVTAEDRGRYHFSEAPYANGRALDQPIVQIGPATEPPANLTYRHAPDAAFPDIDYPGLINVKNPPYNAHGNFAADDTAALQHAINEHDDIFLPKGYYRISRTLQLKPKTRLIGVSHNLSVIITENISAADQQAWPLVQTSTDRDARTALSYIGIYVPYETREAHGAAVDAYALRWQCGGDSLVRNCSIIKMHLLGFPEKPLPEYTKLIYRHPLITATGNGGGRWYNFYNHGSPEPEYMAPEFSYLQISNCRGPLTFYHLHAQHLKTLAQAEIIYSADITLYGTKTEHDAKSFITVRDSDRIRIYGHAGIGTPKEGSSHYYFIDVTNFLLANFAEQVNLKAALEYHGKKRIAIDDYFPLFDITGCTTNTIPKTARPVLYIHGEYYK